MLNIMLMLMLMTCSYFSPIMLNIMLMRKLVPHFIPCHGLITIYIMKVFITTVLKSYLLCSIMLDAFRDLFCSKS